MGWFRCVGLRVGVFALTLAGVVGGFGCGQSRRSDDARTDATVLGGTGGDGGSGAAGRAGASGTIADGSGGTTTIPVPCGDGELDEEEECDDGNRVSGDGCSGQCWFENPPCGDGVVAHAEVCDDANTVSGDGCREDCWYVEPGYLCSPGIPCTLYFQCGDSRLDPNELCDDGNLTSDDGCFGCAVEAGWACEGEPSHCHRAECGDAEVEGVESCDDGGTEPGDGCSPDCRLEPDCSDGVCMPICGDCTLATGEACDDGNLRSRDGCSSDCTIEDGFVCENAAGTASTCASICGDRTVTLGEECDDGANTALYDAEGCGAGCRRPAYCGDGIIQYEFGEMCDDGNDRLGPEGGCSGCVLPP